MNERLDIWLWVTMQPEDEQVLTDTLNPKLDSSPAHTQRSGSYEI
jgi:hypothetical protein